MQKLYRFNDWFHREPGDDGKVRFVLVRGEHYHCSQSSMVQQLRVAATHCGVRVSVTDMEDRVSVVVAKKLEVASA